MEKQLELLIDSIYEQMRSVSKNSAGESCVEWSDAKCIVETILGSDVSQNMLSAFWQHKSDASTLEASEQESAEVAYSDWIKKTFNSPKNQ